MEHSSDAAPQPVGIVVYPLADGRAAWAVGLNTGVCTGVSGQYWPEEGVGEILEAIARVLPPIISFLKVDGIRNREIYARFAPKPDVRKAGDLIPAKWLQAEALRGLPGSRLHVPRARRTIVGADFDPYLLAADGSVANGVTSWAYVTGAGWYTTGTVDRPSSMLAEWIAACEGIHLFRPGANLTLLIDNLSIGAVIRDIAEGTKRKKPKWMSDAAYNAGRNIIRHRRVTVRWIRRNSHPLHALADRLGGEVSRSGLGPTASSSPSQRSRSIWGRLGPFSNTARRRPRWAVSI